MTFVPGQFGGMDEYQVVEQEFNKEHAQELTLAGGDLGAGPGPTTPARLIRYRHDWGNWKGLLIMRLNMWHDIRPDTVMMVSASEGLVGGDTVAGKFVGNAKYTVHNVATRSGGVDIRVEIAWDNPINLQTDYLAVLF
ncbi:hypothetical protein [Spirillospora sp. CA-294931]|uniref:hypothetical protein n=1 Tax=Spirillospora sp. CA-294931 TaxID=3240042 RepID=UPI003D8A92F3